MCVKGSNRRLFIKLWVPAPILLKPLIISVVEAILNQPRFVGGMKLKTAIANCRCTSNCSNSTAKFRKGYKFSWPTVFLCKLGESNITLFGLASMMSII
jgi:hypothetical protein